MLPVPRFKICTHLDLSLKSRGLEAAADAAPRRSISIESISIYRIRSPSRSRLHWTAAHMSRSLLLYLLSCHFPAFNHAYHRPLLTSTALSLAFNTSWFCQCVGSYGVHAEVTDSPPRHLSSRLTILRIVPDDAEDPLGTNPSNDVLPPGPYISRRTSLDPPSSPNYRRTSQNDPVANRLSFASSSFCPDRTPSSPQQSLSSVGRRRSSLIGSPRGRPPPLTPREVYNLAHYNLAHSPVPAKTSPIEDLDVIPRLSPSALSVTGTQYPADRPKVEQPHIVPIPDSQFLPFIDRPTEVAAFLSTEPTNRLMALLQHAFPPDLRLKPSRADDQSPIAPTSPAAFAPAFQSALQRSKGQTASREFGDPEKWSYETLLEWMCCVPREQANDLTWVLAVRRCVMAHNEQICVSLLSALGVPLEGLETLEAEAAGWPPVEPAFPDIQVSGPAFVRNVEQLDESPFEVDISPIPFGRGPPHVPSDDSESTGSTRSRLSLAMESIDEREDESFEEVTGEMDLENTLDASTAEGSVVQATALFERTDKVRDSNRTPVSRSPSLQPKDQHAWQEGSEAGRDWHGLCIATSALPAGTPLASSSRPRAPPPRAQRPKRNSINVAHMLSGAPGHVGFSWRPGGPLFPTTFKQTEVEAPQENDDLSPTLRGRDASVSTPTRKLFNRRAASVHLRSLTIPQVPRVPPNSPETSRSLRGAPF
ncbi:hypothetical protein EVG20_g4230 [Dentipellis fragilis]|uniref:Uncharacterized protein n=1 Tax=Dentipellis fragilis TaxID=205917 RepID=A0A4Y9YYN1_9AGAM|nr:hypothetical protein EVG20_g4230 [Dentipellis fragilis]